MTPFQAASQTEVERRKYRIPGFYSDLPSAESGGLPGKKVRTSETGGNWASALLKRVKYRFHLIDLLGFN
jgi:hypothetical protein